MTILHTYMLTCLHADLPTYWHVSKLNLISSYHYLKQLVFLRSDHVCVVQMSEMSKLYLKYLIQLVICFSQKRSRMRGSDVRGPSFQVRLSRVSHLQAVQLRRSRRDDVARANPRIRRVDSNDAKRSCQRYFNSFLRSNLIISRTFCLTKTYNLNVTVKKCS